MSGADVCVKELFKVYSSADAEPVEVLKGITFDVCAGTTLSVTGPSGSGKSTLLQILGAMEMPSSGDVFVNGSNISQMDEGTRSQFRNREVGFVFQSHYLLPQLSVIDNILVPAWNTRHDREGYIDRAYALLTRVGLGDLDKRLPGQLSGGERQRVAVARALLMSPSLILADEPTGALDQKNTASLMDLLLEMNSVENATLILVTHSGFCADRMQRQLQIIDGVIIGATRMSPYAPCPMPHAPCFKNERKYNK